VHAENKLCLIYDTIKIRAPEESKYLKQNILEPLNASLVISFRHSDHESEF